MQAQQETQLSANAQSRFERLEGEPLFTSDWLHTVMIHYAVEPSRLQSLVPFDLDTRGGRAFVSLVAFEMRGLRPTRYERIGKRLFAPIGNHPFLNVRTYVRHRGEPGIYFLTEFLPNMMSVPLGPLVFGLPYRWGRTQYDNDPRDTNEICGRVCVGRNGAALQYRACVSNSNYAPSATGSQTEFLMERYTAFTRWCGIDRRFRIWHKPWPQVSIVVQLDDDALLRTMPEWYDGAEYCGANYSPGVGGVWMGRPRWMGTRRPANVLSRPVEVK